jgi:UDP-glucose 4-epimerase
MKKILVTGGAGYIGSHTYIELVNAGYAPIIGDNFSNSHRSVMEGLTEICGFTPALVEIDFSDATAVEALFNSYGPFDGVIHFAAFKAVGESVRAPLTYYRNNLGSTQVLLETMQRHECKTLVFSSSCTVYGQPKCLPVTETAPFEPAHSPYGFTKQVCERMISDAVNATPHQLRAVLLRYFNPIGAHPSGKIGELPLGPPENLVPYLTQSAVGIRGPLTVFGNDYNTPDGTCIRDYIHVCDLAEAHVSALSWLLNQETALESVNLGTGKGNSVQEVIDTFNTTTDGTVDYTIGARRAGDIEQIYASAEKAKTLFNWNTKRSLADALRDAWRWQLELQTRETAS